MNQVARLADADLRLAVSPGGPPDAGCYDRIGDVRARRLSEATPWRTETGDELRGAAGDWYVTDSSGSSRTVADAEFRRSHEPLGGDSWRRVGTYRAWQVSEAVVIRTKEGNATANAGDWIVEGTAGERWPVPDGEFQRSYQRTSSGRAAGRR